MHAAEPHLELTLAELADGLELLALRVLQDRDEAVDAVQETLTRLLRVLNGKGISVGYTLESYAFGILKHVLADIQRERGRRWSLSHLLHSVHADALEQLASTEDKMMVSRALDRLDVDDRELLQRCYWNGERVSDIARQTGEPADRIRKRKSRALERLRGLVGDAERHVSVSPADPEA